MVPVTTPPPGAEKTHTALIDILIVKEQKHWKTDWLSVHKRLHDKPGRDEFYTGGWTHSLRRAGLYKLQLNFLGIDRISTYNVNWNNGLHSVFKKLLKYRLDVTFLWVCPQSLRSIHVYKQKYNPRADPAQVTWVGVCKRKNMNLGRIHAGFAVKFWRTYTSVMEFVPLI